MEVIDFPVDRSIARAKMLCYQWNFTPDAQYIQFQNILETLNKWLMI